MAQEVTPKRKDVDWQQVARRIAAQRNALEERLATTQEALGDAEARVHLEQQANSTLKNANADFGDLFKANRRYSVGVMKVAFSWIDNVYLQTHTIANMHKLIHTKKWPPFYIIALFIAICLPFVAILVYPPYAFGIGQWLSVGSNGLLFFGFLIAIIFFGLIFMLTRRRRTQQ